MSDVINGNGTIPQTTNPAQVAIASSTNASPIEVTTSGSHGYNDGDTVEVEAHEINTAANGLWRITKVSSTKYTLDGSTGNGVGGATGYSVDHSINPLITVPVDLDLVDASSVDPAFEALFNLAPFIQQRLGRYRLLEQGYVYLGSYFNTTAGNPTLGTSFGDTGIGPIVTAYALKSTDIIVARLVGALFCTGTVEVAVGIAFDWGSGPTLITGGSCDLTPSLTNTDPSHVSCEATLTGQVGNSVSISVQSMAASGGPYALSWRGEARLSFEHYRLNA